jgi:hypothetical protein
MSAAFLRRLAPLGRLLCLLLVMHSPTSACAADELANWLARFERLVPTAAAGFGEALPEESRKAAVAIEIWAANVGNPSLDETGQNLLDALRRLHLTKARVDKLLDRTLDARRGFAALPPDVQRPHIRSYLRTTARLIDLSGRLRYLISDVLSDTFYEFERTEQREKLIDLLIEQNSSIGAHVALETILPTLPAGEQPLPGMDRLAAKLFKLVGRAGQLSLLPRLAEFVGKRDANSLMRLEAAEAIMGIGLPQDARAGSPDDTPAPAITAAALRSHLAGLSAGNLPDDAQPRHAALLATLDQLAREGVSEESYRLGSYELRPGDWLLMRNPSPYNLFTDLSPGLFTHVGVVTSERGADGIRRMVLVDLQERGKRMAATNVDLFVQRSLHYAFLRFPDAKVAAQMAEAARSVIGNETEFDLNFRTARVLALAHQPLAGKKISTYCAGLLLLCALQTDVPREQFFPITEHAAPGHTIVNLAKLGMSFGRDFVSPTGALFSPKLEFVGQREPMYDPRREIEEGVFDHFAEELVAKPINPTSDMFDSLRMKVAQAAQQSSALARVLAKAAGVSSDTDLEGAARGAAVVETLDEVAFGASAEFTKAREALLAAPARIGGRRRPGAEFDTLARYQVTHAELFEKLQKEELSLRQLRVALVGFYLRQGKAEIDRRFFVAQP